MEMFIKNSEGKTRDRPIDKWWDIYFSMIHSMYLNIVASFPNAATSLFRIYNANIYEVDNELNLFLDTLVKSDLINNTIIVFMSDHGEAFFEHGVLEHGYSLSSQYNEMIRTPLFVYIPGVKGRAVKAVTRNIDIFPTIFELIGFNDAPFSNQSHGNTLVPLMKEPSIFDRVREDFAISFSDSLVSVQDKSWKMIANLCDENTLMVYNLANDPQEKLNVVTQNVRISKKFMNLLEKEVRFDRRNIGIYWSEQFVNRKNSCLR